MATKIQKFMAASGDRNTSFFHAKASNRFQRNTICGLCDETGTWKEDDRSIEQTILNYFSMIFRSNGPTDSKVVEVIQPRISTAMNESLLHAFTAEEVSKALKQMHPKKAPGPDGMPPLFYQHFWPLMSNCVIKIVLDFLNHGLLLPNFNDTHIVLIPKVKNPTKITQYRPISLSNVVSRLASNVLANRLKWLFPQIISENHSTFMSNRLITDNVLVAFETMHHISQKRSDKVGEMALKLDMSKAYDRVEWGCLEGIMRKMGFAEEWVTIMMRCVSTVKYSVKINGKPRGCITPTRGLR